jgi:carbonic anhydrase
MRLLEAVIDANHRALSGDEHAGLHPAEFADELPIVALTCIDPRLNRLMPGVLGVPEDQFIWLRNAGNIIYEPLSSMMRSLALACAVKGGKEIAIIGHSDCQVCKITTMQLIDRFRALGVERNMLPENLNEFFGMFGSERQNVIKGVDIARHSPLIGPKVPVHGLLVDIQSGKLDWLVNGYQAMELMAAQAGAPTKTADSPIGGFKPLADFQIGGLKFPEAKIGETVAKAGDWLSAKVQELEAKAPVSRAEPAKPQPPDVEPALDKPPKIPIPPPIRPRIHVHRDRFR